MSLKENYLKTAMTKKSKTTTMEDTMKWKREAPGHYVLWGEYIVEEKE